MSVRMYTAALCVAVLCVPALASMSGEASGLNSGDVDFDTVSRDFMISTTRTQAAEMKAQSLLAALVVFGGIFIASCIPCACCWYTLYKEQNQHASWAKPSSLMPMPITPAPMSTAFRPTSPMTYRAAGPSPVMIRQA